MTTSVIPHRDLAVVDEPHNEIYEGDNYRYCDPTTLASGVSQDYLITTPNTTKYILRITSGAVGNKCNIDLSWYEHTSLGE